MSDIQDIQLKVKLPRYILLIVIILLFIACLIIWLMYPYHFQDFIGQILVYIFLPLLIIYILTFYFLIISGYLLVLSGVFLAWINIKYFYHIIYIDYLELLFIGIGIWIIVLCTPSQDTSIGRKNNYIKVFWLWLGISFLLSVFTVFFLLFNSLGSFSSGIYRLLFFNSYRLLYVILLYMVSFFNVFPFFLYEKISAKARELLPSDEYFKLIAESKELAQYFALCQKIIVVFNNHIYIIN